MTTYALMSAQTVPNNDAAGSAPVPVSVPGAPTRAKFTFSLSKPATTFTQATVLASVPGFTYPTQQIIYDPLLVLELSAGQQSVSQDFRFGAAYNSFEATLNSIAAGNLYSASLTMEV